MAGKFARSWALMKASAAVLRSDKSLLVFPLLSGLCTLLVAASFLVPVGMAMVGQQQAGEQIGRHMSAGTYLLMFCFYLVQYFVIIFFQTALTGVALMHLRGEPASVGAGFALARARLPQILGYALIAATVGLLLRMVQERLGLIGRLAAGFIGLAWTVATFLVVPVLAGEGVGPVDAVKRSVELLKRSWGENLIGNGGIGVVFGLLMVLAVLLGAALIGGAVALQSAAAIVLAAVVVVLGLTLLGLVQASLQGIYSAALYRYAEAGEASVGFDQALLQQAFAPKKK
ncbi:hypothetical protein RHOFW510R12_14605 [Rhodanobacter sp. FW510-R12]|uniref:DUF6159 family protein n=1 Tax=unclassified Rhodanobacter TaxID=2621553 RepID=UPI0007AA0BEF|nr:MULTISPECIES: DUF6159 family protein [unclassified Rhodanobacter]KZC15994.1 hypothetical protein RHOFW104R8_02085 [Rhodanobacter sp. FW104-R8]KZC25454.1 hypothetical protein RhoFW510T8_07255 [Rhodanobacter sp. FW510-T8]KZC32256.1 hypothetical protein RhoFW510R10_13905 [Rhodanobacter sp. FW510-R10]